MVTSGSGSEWFWGFGYHGKAGPFLFEEAAFCAALNEISVLVHEIGKPVRHITHTRGDGTSITLAYAHDLEGYLAPAQQAAE